MIIMRIMSSKNQLLKFSKVTQKVDNWHINPLLTIIKDNLSSTNQILMMS